MIGGEVEIGSVGEKTRIIAWEEVQFIDGLGWIILLRKMQVCIY